MPAEAFLAFYPQFSSFSQGPVLPEYVRQANARFGDFGADAEEARRLFTAHKLTLYSASRLPGEELMAAGNGQPPQGGAAAADGAERRFTMAQLASAGRGALKEIASKKAGDVAISYNTSSSVSASVMTGFSDLKETVYGLQLLSMLRLYGRSRYIP